MNPRIKKNAHTQTQPKQINQRQNGWQIHTTHNHIIIKSQELYLMEFTLKCGIALVNTVHFLCEMIVSACIDMKICQNAFKWCALVVCTRDYS